MVSELVDAAKPAAFFTGGGPLMFANLLPLAAAVAVTVERIAALMFRFNLNPGPFMEQISKLVLTGNVDRAVKLCDAAPDAPLAKVIRAGLVHAHGGGPELARALREAIAAQAPAITARIPWLWSFANVAAAIGLAGAVFGVVRAFGALGDVPSTQKQRLLSEGLETAVNNAAFGLSIAVLCILSHRLLTWYSKRMLGTIERSARELEDLVARRPAAIAPAVGRGRSA